MHIHIFFFSPGLKFHTVLRFNAPDEPRTKSNACVYAENNRQTTKFKRTFGRFVLGHRHFSNATRISRKRERLAILLSFSPAGYPKRFAPIYTIFLFLIYQHEICRSDYASLQILTNFAKTPEKRNSCLTC